MEAGEAVGSRGKSYFPSADYRQQHLLRPDGSLEIREGNALAKNFRREGEQVVVDLPQASRTSLW